MILKEYWPNNADPRKVYRPINTDSRKVYRPTNTDLKKNTGLTILIQEKYRLNNTGPRKIQA